MIGFPLSCVVNAPGAGGAPPSGAFSNPLIIPVIESYQHSIVATGGFEACRVDFSCGADEALYWLAQLMGAIVVYGPEGEIAWEGYVRGVSATIGQERIDLSMDDVANAVRVRYQPDIGAQVSTAFGTDTFSIATYGRKELIYSGSGMTSTAATTLRDTLLDQRAWPVATRASTIATAQPGAEARVSIIGEGWYYTTDWLTTSNTTTATAVTTTQVQTLVTAYSATNPFFSSNYADILASGVSDTQAIEPDTTYRKKIERLLSLGNSSGQRIAYGVYDQRRWTARTWAGATPTAITYQRYLGDGRIYTATNAEVPGYMVRPDAMYQVVDLLDTAVALPDGVARFYVERVTYSVDARGQSVRLEPAKSGELEVLLARLR